MSTLRFIYCTQRYMGSLGDNCESMYRIVALELKPNARLPYPPAMHVPHTGIRNQDVKRTLKQTEYVPLEQCIDYLIRVERVVTALNRMEMALQAVELEPNGIQNLFNQLWSSDQL